MTTYGTYIRNSYTHTGYASQLTMQLTLLTSSLTSYVTDTVDRTGQRRDPSRDGGRFVRVCTLDCGREVVPVENVFGDARPAPLNTVVSFVRRRGVRPLHVHVARAVEGCLGAVGVGLSHACVVRGGRYGNRLERQPVRT